MGSTRSALLVIGKAVNEVISFIIFLVLDLLDVFLCFVYKLLDSFIEAERSKPCYCSSSSAKDSITSSGKILVSEKGECSKIVFLSSSNSKVELEDISDTLYNRPSFFSEMAETTVKQLKRLKVKNDVDVYARSTSFTINSTIVEMLQGKIGAHPPPNIPRWSDCDCNTCTSWSRSSCTKDTLHVRVQGPKDGVVKENVLFIHGFVSSSSVWSETLFPNFSEETKSCYRLFAIDLLGFGRSPKPADSLYTLRDHIEMIERSVIEQFKVKSFHIVAHSLGCILALAIAVKYPGSVKSLTLLAPPYFPAPKGEQTSQFVLRSVAPRRVWPLMTFGAALICWYEHISRTIHMGLCKNHRLWEKLTKFVTRNRMRTYLIEGFFCHTHNASWHTLHNIICGAGSKLDEHLDAVRYELSCPVNIFHGRDDDLIPIECSYAVQSRVPRAHLKIIDNKDHLTVIVGRQEVFARELEEIWWSSSRTSL